VRIRLRTDNRYIAERKALGDAFNPQAGWYTEEEWNAVPPAAPGDTWRAWWYSSTAAEHIGPLAGYDIACPRCRRVHAWTTAINCASRRPLATGGFTCDHTGTGSCWTWTGTLEDGTLSASPSLHSDPAHGGCGFHGHLTNGDLSG
jgi:hypothetical protein